jgi:hypothetical protein
MSKYAIKLFQQINYIKEVIKTNEYNHNLFVDWCYLDEYLSILLNLTGILNKPFRTIFNGLMHNLEVWYYSSTNKFNKNSQIIINYFGILNKPSFVMTICWYYIMKLSETNIINKLILIYGKY